MDAIRLIEGLVFASRDPVSEVAMRDVLGRSGFEASLLPQILETLVQDYSGRAMALQQVGRAWQFRTRPEFSEALMRVVEKPRRLSRAAMETLAIIAYHQPCTRAEIEALRGVSLGQNVLEALIDDGLIAPDGRKEVPGRPVLWSTTSSFLAKFGLKSLADLPRREELILDLETTSDIELKHESDPPKPTAQNKAGHV